MKPSIASKKRMLISEQPLSEIVNAAKYQHCRRLFQPGTKTCEAILIKVASRHALQHSEKSKIFDFQVMVLHHTPDQPYHRGPQDNYLQVKFFLFCKANTWLYIFYFVPDLHSHYCIYVKVLVKSPVRRVKIFLWVKLPI